jgi:hypothetical protein
VNLSKGNRRLLLQECAESKDSTLEVFTWLPQGVRASPSERIRVEKLRRYSTFVISSKESTGFLCREMFQARVASACTEISFS